MRRKWRPFSLITHHFPLKFISLILACLLWVAIASAPLSEVTYTVPLEFRNMPEGQEVASENIPAIQVRVRGSDRIVRRLQPQDIHIVLDLRSMAHENGERTFDLSPGQIKLPSDLQVVQVIPSSVRLSMDKSSVKVVEVRPRVIGTFAPGVRIARVTVDPPRVAIAGPMHRVEAIDGATTDAIDASGVNGKQTFLSIPYVADPLVRLEKPTTVRITVVTEHASD